MSNPFQGYISGLNEMVYVKVIAPCLADSKQLFSWMAVAASSSIILFSILIESNDTIIKNKTKVHNLISSTALELNKLGIEY